MSRVQLFRDIGLDVETAVELDDELSRLPARTQRVFVMRMQGYPLELIGRSEGVSKQAASARLMRCKTLYAWCVDKTVKSVPYINRGEDAT